ncbi:MAG: hypothetical protein RI916_1201 [Actinomycetota bacterium]
MPDATVVRSAFAHDAAESVVAESLFAQPVNVSAAAITTAALSGWIQEKANKAVRRCLHASYMQ